MKTKKRSLGIKGYAAIELTLSLPFMLMMLCVVADFGRLYTQYVTLEKGVRGAARWAVSSSEASDGYTNDFKNKIINVVAYGKQNPSGDDSTILKSMNLSLIDVTTSTVSGIDYVTISASHDYTPMFTKIPYLSDVLDLTFSASSVMRVWP